MDPGNAYLAHQLGAMLRELSDWLALSDAHARDLQKQLDAERKKNHA